MSTPRCRIAVAISLFAILLLGSIPLAVPAASQTKTDGKWTGKVTSGPWSSDLELEWKGNESKFKQGDGQRWDADAKLMAPGTVSLLYGFDQQGKPARQEAKLACKDGKTVLTGSFVTHWRGRPNTYDMTLSKSGC